MSKRLESYRIGDRNEAICLAYMRLLGFVAPVPREEDIGLDATLTLSERREKSSFPKETCGIQIKSKSCQGIYFDQNRLDYLCSLPFSTFVLQRSRGEVSVFSTINVRLSPLRIRGPGTLVLGTPSILDLDKVQVEAIGESGFVRNDDEHGLNGFFDAPSFITQLECFKRLGKLKSTKPPKAIKENWFVFSGFPVATYSEHDLERSQVKRNEVVKILEEHIRREREAFDLMKIGIHALSYNWTTNGMPSSLSQVRAYGPLGPDGETVKAVLVNLVSTLDHSNKAPKNIKLAAKTVFEWLNTQGVFELGSHCLLKMNVNDQEEF